MIIKKFNEYIKEEANYHQLNDGDEYDIVKVTRDNYHNYSYCDGIQYELGRKGNDKVVYVSEIEHTVENMFYSDQIDRYIQYLKEGGILESFPVIESNLNGVYTLGGMLEYVEENIFDDNMDELYNKLNKKFIDDILGGSSIFDLTSGEVVLGIDGHDLQDISDIKELDFLYNDKDYEDSYLDEDYEEGDELRFNLYGYPIYYTKEYYEGFKAILEYWEENKSYTLTDMNHRFSAVKELGKTMVYVEVVG